MVKLKGPLGSAEASGTLGRTAIFSSWKGRAYAKAHAVPSNPNTAPQISVRAMLAFLSQQWAAFTVPNKATWNEIAAQKNIPPYNAFLSDNLDRWKRFHAPGKVYPISALGTLPDLDHFTISGGLAKIRIESTWEGLNNVWGMMIFHSLTPGFTPSRANLIHIQTITEYTPNTWIYQTTILGLHYLNFRTFTTTAKLSSNLGQASALVT
jgi:hypothetical protein